MTPTKGSGVQALASEGWASASGRHKIAAQPEPATPIHDLTPTLGAFIRANTPSDEGIEQTNDADIGRTDIPSDSTSTSPATSNPPMRPDPNTSPLSLPFDQQLSKIQHLTFSYAQEVFTSASLPWSEQTRISCHLTDEDTGAYTNTALLISDQCPFGSKCARFDGDLKTSLAEHEELGGSLLQQLNLAMVFLNRHNPEGKVPEDAMREALVNAFLHRDYGYSGPTLINIFTSRMEFVSLGGLVDGLEVNDLLNGICQTRNSWLSDLFAALQLSRNYGTGIQRILEDYEESVASPQLRVGPSSVAMVLPTPVSPDEAWPDVSQQNQRNLPQADDLESERDRDPQADQQQSTASKRYAFPAIRPSQTNDPSQALAGMRVIGVAPLTTLILSRGIPDESPVPVDLSEETSSQPGEGPAAGKISETDSKPGEAMIETTRYQNRPDATEQDIVRNPDMEATSLLKDLTPLRSYPIKTLEEVTLHLFANSGVKLSRADIEHELKLNKNQTAYLLRSLTNQGKIAKHGKSRATSYSLS
ncbi:ATP-binding protein [Bifidobacterium aemilianum]|uniref:ATP-binding protein n=1 Tax=Bifidobacterium aemilianum TaxID=2493120 RepID=UPI001374A6F8|nr:ATP-binding protein [Bifidobacterium aemilianum]